jgi:shikimate kinase
MPGSGKSTLGKALADYLGIGFYDLDHYIELHAGKDINRIFSEDQESGFRYIENQCLKKLTALPEAKVIATGGGTPCFHDNMDYMNDHGTTVFLDVQLEIIADRLSSQGTEDRPLLKDKTPGELLGQLHEHFEQRKHHYLKARIHLEGGAITLEQITNELSTL